jgi:hypothetical protein
MAATANSGMWVSCRHQPDHPAQAEARPEPVEEMGEFGFRTTDDGRRTTELQACFSVLCRQSIG